MNLTILPADCITLIGYQTFPSLHILSTLQCTSQHFNKLLQNTMNIHDENSFAYSALKANYNLCTKLLISYAKQANETNFDKFWQLHKERRDKCCCDTLDKRQDKPNVLQEKIYLYAGHPSGKNTRHWVLFDYFINCQDILLSKNILEENHNFAELDSIEWNFDIFFKHCKQCLIQNFLTGPHGRGIDFHDEEHETFLHIACREGNLELVQFLLENNTAIDPLNDYKQTPLLIACKIKNKNKQIISLLIKKGANINHKINSPRNGPDTILEYMQRNHVQFSDILKELGY
jgi:hypothetical protein